MRKSRQEPAGVKQPYHHGDLKAALMTAALQLIDRHGVKGFSLKDAAASAGVSTAAPYRHFADKEALLDAIRGEGFGLFNASLVAAYAGAESARDKIVELGVAYVRFALEHPAHFQLMFSMKGGEGPPEEPGDASGFMLLVQAVAALHPGASSQTRDDLVLVCWSLVHGFAMLQREGVFDATVGSGDAEERLRRALSLLIERTV